MQKDGSNHSTSGTSRSLASRPFENCILLTIWVSELDGLQEDLRRSEADAAGLRSRLEAAIAERRSAHETAERELTAARLVSCMVSYSIISIHVTWKEKSYFLQGSQLDLLGRPEFPFKQAFWCPCVLIVLFFYQEVDKRHVEARTAQRELQVLANILSDRRGSEEAENHG
jgi:hypothetical protein